MNSTITYPFGIINGINYLNNTSITEVEVQQLLIMLPSCHTDKGLNLFLRNDGIWFVLLITYTRKGDKLIPSVDYDQVGLSLMRQLKQQGRTIAGGKEEYYLDQPM